jgi:tetratricopeptide (TPR) repeat protein
VSRKTALSLLVALGVAWSPAAHASPEEHAKAASDYVTSASRNAGRVTSLSGGRTIRAISENVIDGELALRGRAFDEAITIFTKVLESTGPREGALHYNARFLRAQALHEHGEPGSAIIDYQALLAAAGQPGSGDYPVRAVDRLVGLGLARRDRELLKSVLGRAETLRIGAPDAEAAYARAKAYVEVGDAAKARTYLEQAGASKPLQAAYYEAMLVLREEASALGPNASRREAFPRALAAFEALSAQSPGADTDAGAVVQLAKLAVARLRYERREFAAASEIYRSIGTSSPLFDQAAAELAWSQVQRGDSAGAERALELLAEARPRSGELAEGQLLRADLSLRNGSFGKALELYKSVRAVLEPQREAIDAYLKARPNPEDFYDLISKREMEIVGSGDKLPPMAIRVVRDDPNGQRAIDVAADIGLVRGLVEQLQRRAKLLEKVASDPNRAVNLAEFRGSSKELTAVANQVARGRLEVALGLDDANLAVGSDELAQVRERRKLLMPLVEQLPLTADALSARGDVADDGLSRIADALLRADKEASGLLDQIEKMRDLVRRDEERGVERDPQARARVLANLDVEAQALLAQRDLVRDTQRIVEEVRAGSGGEAGLVAMEASARREFNALVDREVELVSAQLAASTYGARVKTTIDDAKRVDADLDRLESDLKAKASDRAAAVQAELAQRLAEVTQLTGRLDDLEKDARAVCGGVARANVQVARKQLRDLLLKADVGVTAHAWEVREEQQHRVNAILAEKAKRERLVNEEMRDALEDGSVAVFKETNAPPR